MQWPNWSQLSAQMLSFRKTVQRIKYISPKGLTKLHEQAGKLNPAHCFPGHDSSPESTSAEQFGWGRTEETYSRRHAECFLCVSSASAFGQTGCGMALEGWLSSRGSLSYPQGRKWWNITVRDASLQSQFVICNLNLSFKPYLCFLMKS